MPIRRAAQIRISAGAVVSLATLAAADATVQGIARAAGQPIAGARITLFTPALTFFRETRSDSAGAYQFPAIPTGSYQLGIAALNYDYQESPVAIAAAPITRDFALAPESQQGRWDIIGTTAPEFFDATDIAILTPQGKVFLCHDTIDPVLFDPVTGLKTFPIGSGLAQGCMNASLLPDGRLCMVGGQEGSAPGSFTQAVPWVKAFGPGAPPWTRLADMQLTIGRWYTGLARLADGSFLVMGGGTRPSAARTPTCERLDLATLTWSYTGSMINPCEFPPAAMLPTGEVLATWSPPQLYNPQTGQWRLTGNFIQPTRGWPNHSDHSMVILSDGRAFVAGIRKGGNNYTGMGEVYNPASGTWSLTGTSPLPRSPADAVQIPDGRVLVAGGDISNQLPPSPPPNTLGCVKWSELYDPALNAFRRIADMNWFREYHAVSVLVPDGRVVMTGGTTIKFQVGPTSQDIEAFVPPNLLRGIRPQITSLLPATLHRGEALRLDIFPATALTSIVLMGTQTHTHWVQGGIDRRIVLPVQQNGPSAAATLPTDPNLLPLGFYMLFAMVDDIPSVGRIVQVIDGAPCYANCDGSTTSPILNVNDFACFLNAFAAGQPWANCDGSTSVPILNVLDFGCFLNRFAAGCS